MSIITKRYGKGVIKIKRNLLILLSVIFLSVVVLGCSTPVDSKSMAKDTVTQYKNQIYNISDYANVNKVLSNMDETIRYIEGFKGHMSEEGYKRFESNRIGTMPLDVCNKGKFNLKTTNIKFKKITEENNKIIMEYELNLQASYPDNNITKSMVETGEVALIKENNTWKIDHDWFRVVDLFEQELGMGQGAIMKF